MTKNNLPRVFNSKTPKVYKNKKLNNANFGNFTHNDYQVYLHLVSKIGGVDKLGKYLQPQELQREHTLTAKEFSELFNVSTTNCYVILKQAVDKLMKTDITVEKTEVQEAWRINLCSTAKYNKTEGCISIKFTDDIMPYIAQVKEKFTLYNLKEIANFGSLYTTRLYELLQDFKTTGWMLKSVEELREAFAVGDKLKSYKDFKNRTFAHACQEINNNYDMELRFEEIKKGRKIVEVKFFFKPTKVIQRFDKNGQVNNTYISPKAIIKPPKPKIVKPSKKINKLIDVTPELDSSQEKKIKPKNIFRSLFDKIKSGKFKS
ncbi:MAG: replication initiation protein [Silvanigrellaceae bacterium]|jgi:plasmid replication initiation protein|nr:replication initiation protein [Silvanigrellaceae bacterium]